MKGTLYFLVNLGLSLAAAPAAVVLSHRIGGRAWHELLYGSHQVPQLLIYTFDFIPFFAVSFLALWYGTARWRRHLDSTTVLLLSLGAGVAAVVLHLAFFAVSLKSIAYVLLFVIYFAFFFMLFSRLGVRLKFASVPAVKGPHGWLLASVAAGVAFIAALKGMAAFGLLEARVFYDDQRALTSAAPFARPSWREPKPVQRGPYDFGAPRPSLFTIERFPHVIHDRRPAMVDFDGDGDTDIFHFDPTAGHYALLENEGGRFVEKNGFWNRLTTPGVHLVDDVDGDGRKEILLSLPFQRQSSFEYGFLKKSFWYPFERNTVASRLLSQTKPGRWEDITAKAFPENNANGYRKVEPNVYVDLDGDGLKEIVWSQYPNGRRHLNRLFVQGPGGVFHDRLDELLTWSAPRVYPEGSDMADVDGDGDIDLFAYGFPFLNHGGRFVQVCGDDLKGFHCDSATRNDEGGLFEDVNGDGILDLVVSYFGMDWSVPRYTVQVYLGSPDKPGSFAWVGDAGTPVYGTHYYFRGKDFDFNGIPDILTREPGRLITFRGNRPLDILPNIFRVGEAPLVPLGWLDVDEDGDWDALVSVTPSPGGQPETLLLRNTYDPRTYVKIDVRGEDMRDNQTGTTVTLTLPEGRRLVQAYRPRAGYQGDADPRLVFVLDPGRSYGLRACYPSLSSPPEPGSTVGAGTTLRVTTVEQRCIGYELTVARDAGRIDLTLVAGRGVAVLGGRGP